MPRIAAFAPTTVMSRSREPQEAVPLPTTSGATRVT
jgi:hypothetical protein